MSITNRFQAMSVTHPISINRKIDQYLSERLPDLMDDFKIAVRSDTAEIDRELEGLEGRMDDLDVWKNGFEDRIKDGRTRMDRLKVKYGVK